MEENKNTQKDSEQVASAEPQVNRDLIANQLTLIMAQLEHGRIEKAQNLICSTMKQIGLRSEFHRINLTVEVIGGRKFDLDSFGVDGNTCVFIVRYHGQDKILTPEEISMEEHHGLRRGVRAAFNQLLSGTMKIGEKHHVVDSMKIADIFCPPDRNLH